MTKSEQEDWLIGHTDLDDPIDYRHHKYVGGLPPKRIMHMQLAHETRARKHGVRWDMVDLRRVFQRDEGLCGICRQPVNLDEFTIDHIKPLHLGGPHTFQNLQIAHAACNTSKGRRYVP